ncbi:Translation initiation factor eif-2b epsilon subunit, partial [Spraguea lophii 42_110]
LNIPLIEYILESLYVSDLLDIIIVGGERIRSVLEYIKNTKYSTLLNIEHLNIEVRSFGDIIREMDCLNFEIENFIVIFANNFTTFDLRKILKKHKEYRKKMKNVIMTTYLFRRQKSKLYRLYGMKDKEIVYYKYTSDKEGFDDTLLDVVNKYGEIEMNADLSAHGFIVITKEVFSLFRDNFDYQTLDDMIEGLLLFNPYSYKIMAFVPEEKRKADKLEEQLKRIKLNNDKNNIHEESEDIEEESEDFFFATSLTSLKDYFFINDEFKRRYAVPHSPSTFKIELGIGNDIQRFVYGYYFADELEGISESIVGRNSKIEEDIPVRSSFISDGCEVKASLNDCIIWDGVSVTENLTDCLVISNNADGIIQISLCDEEPTDSESQDEPKNKESFYSDVLDYLISTIEPLLNNNLPIETIVQQVNLFRIMWNASNYDLLEVFAIFLVEILDHLDFDNSTITGSLFFPVISGTTKEIESQEFLLENINENLAGKSKEFRENIVGMYGFLLLEDGYISRRTLRKCLRLIKEDEM